MKNIKKWINNILIFMLLISGVFMMFFSLAKPHFKHTILNISDKSLSQVVFTQRAVEFIAGIVLLFICIGLFKRLRVTWIVAIIILPFAIFANLLHRHFIISILQMLITVAFLVLAKDYKRKSHATSFKMGLLFATVSLLIILANTAVHMYWYPRGFNITSIWDAISKSAIFLFTMDVSAMDVHGKVATIYLESTLIFNWIALFTAAFFILKPAILNPIINLKEKNLVLHLLNEHGENPLSYISVEDDKNYFFASDYSGFIAYTIASGVAVCAGDPVAPREKIIFLISEFLDYCSEYNMSVCFCQTIPEYREFYKALGFGHIKYGEEAMFNLNEYTTAGKKCVKLRQAISGSTKAGVIIKEYCPKTERDRVLESKMQDLSDIWKESKGGADFSFMISKVGLDNHAINVIFMPLTKADNYLDLWCSFLS